MSTLNSIPFTAAGNLTADPELRFTGTGRPVTGCGSR
jgi:single-stranded DNA-binding protein